MGVTMMEGPASAAAPTPTSEEETALDMDPNDRSTYVATNNIVNNNSGNDDKHVFSPELLKMYYARLFPYSFLHTWLSYNPNPNGGSDNGSNSSSTPSLTFTRREFSFTLEPIPGEEIYIRYQSFSNEHDLKAAIVKRQPRKIDIGAVFSHPPKDKNAYPASAFHPVQRELVFDIDLTDYDGVRNCGCHGAKICPVCWTFMQMACRVMHEGLREDFGFQHIAWFYSGRRGIHAWVCDEEARSLTNEARSAVANYFEVGILMSVWSFFLCLVLALLCSPCWKSSTHGCDLTTCVLPLSLTMF
jgi:DNA primase small subunit